MNETGTFGVLLRDLEGKGIDDEEDEEDGEDEEVDVDVDEYIVCGILENDDESSEGCGLDFLKRFPMNG